jgi:hypothetical protein
MRLKRQGGALISAVSDYYMRTLVAQIEGLGIEGLDSDVRGVSGGKELFQSRK